MHIFDWILLRWMSNHTTTNERLWRQECLLGDSSLWTLVKIPGPDNYKSDSVSSVWIGRAPLCSTDVLIMDFTINRHSFLHSLHHYNSILFLYSHLLLPCCLGDTAKLAMATDTMLMGVQRVERVRQTYAEYQAVVLSKEFSVSSFYLLSCNVP